MISLSSHKTPQSHLSHEYFMRRAIALAQKGRFTASPNPNVGCVIVLDHQIIGEGYHQKAGLAHAEVNALNDAKKNHADILCQATAYVTLEPCCHFGKTPPCTKALIDARIQHVVIGSTDPNPKVSSKGITQLKQAGIKVTTDILKSECDTLNTSFFHAITHKKPWVRLKLGMSLDAKVATQTGESQWITSQAAREDVQLLRAESDAIISTAKTVIADNAKLNVRTPSILATPYFKQPKAVIIDKNLSTQSHLNIFNLEHDVLIYHQKKGGLPSYSSKVQLIDSPITQRYIDFDFILRDLAKSHHCNQVLIEAGGTLAGHLITNQQVDELIIYIAPKLLGNLSKPAFDFVGAAQLSMVSNYKLISAHCIGQDIKAVYQK